KRPIGWKRGYSRQPKWGLVALYWRHWYNRRMRWGGTLAIGLVVCASAALAGGRSVASPHPFESCLATKALALERSGAEVGEVLLAAERACQDARGELSDAAVGEIASRIRLAVMQQRSNAL